MRDWVAHIVCFMHCVRVCNDRGMTEERECRRRAVTITLPDSHSTYTTHTTCWDSSCAGWARLIADTGWAVHWTQCQGCVGVCSDRPTYHARTYCTLRLRQGDGSKRERSPTGSLHELHEDKRGRGGDDSEDDLDAWEEEEECAEDLTSQFDLAAVTAAAEHEAEERVRALAAQGKFNTRQEEEKVVTIFYRER